MGFDNSGVKIIYGSISCFNFFFVIDIRVAEVSTMWSIYGSIIVFILLNITYLKFTGIKLGLKNKILNV